MQARIDDEAELFTAIDTFAVTRATGPSVVAAVQDFTRRHASRMPGFISAAIHVSQERGQVIVYSQWQCDRHYAEMKDSPAGRSYAAELTAMASKHDCAPCCVVWVSGTNCAAADDRVTAAEFV